MALGSLSIIFIVLGILILGSQFLLYQQNTLEINFVFILNVLLSFLLSWLVFSSLPVNYTMDRFLSLIWGILGIISFLLVFSDNKINLSRILLTVALFGGFFHLVFL